MTKIKTVEDLWAQFKRVNYGPTLDQIHPMQLQESKLVFFGAVGMLLVHQRDDISELSEDDGAKRLQEYIDQVMAFTRQAAEDYKNQTGPYARRTR